MRFRLLVAGLLAAALTVPAAPCLATPALAARPPDLTWYVFFATWCSPCRLELAAAQVIYERYRSRGLELVAVSEDGPASAGEIPAFLRRYGVTGRWLRDGESRLLTRYHPAASVPFSVLVDARGAVVLARAGYEPGDERLFEAAIVAALPATATVTNAQSPGKGAHIVREAPGPSHTASIQSVGVARSSRFDAVASRDSRLLGAVGRLEGALRRGAWTAGVRADGAWLDDEVDGLGRDLRLERAFLSADWERVQLRLGDGHVAFGQGLTLSMRRIDALGADIALRGARVEVGDEDLRFRALGGLANSQNLDPIAWAVRQDADDRLGGVELLWRPVQTLTIAPYGLWLSAPGAAPDGADISWMLGGASATWQHKGSRAAIEAAGGRERGLQAEDRQPWAVFGRLGQDIGAATWLLEARAARHWQIGRAHAHLRYHEPPSLERDDQVVPGDRDVLGGRARLEWRLDGRTVLHANAMHYRFATDGSEPIRGGDASHVFGGFEKRFSSRDSVALGGGWRVERKPGGVSGGGLWHVDVDLSLGLPGTWSLTGKWNHRSEEALRFAGLEPFVRGLGVLGVAFRRRYVLSLLYGYSSEVRVRPFHYPAVEARLVLPRGGELRVLGGRLSGGRVCASGACRSLPPFEGARLDAVLRF